ncbi:AraC family transcriptional regulator [Maribellus mangrovi]|uniref:AraC family transcriptional regulator n=1 Tax=Maribellus mangrovi TaxID=3133146 RepID=UPI0030EEAA7B
MSARPSMDEQFLQKLTRAIDEHLADENFGVNELAAELGMSRTTLHRKVKQVIKKSVSTFIRETRLKRSIELLQNKSGTVAEIAYQVGFSSTTYFTKCFHDFYGFPPGDVLKGNHEIEEEQVKEKKTNKRTILSGVVITAFIIVLLLLYFSTKNRRFGDSKLSIAILPLSEMNSTENTYSALSALRIHLHGDLGNLENLDVISKLETDKYKNLSVLPDLNQINKDLRADVVISISVGKVGNKLELNTLLDNTKTGKQISGNTYSLNPDGENVDEISNQITLDVAKELRISPTKEEKEKISVLLTENKAALRHYNMGIGLSEYAKNHKFSPEWHRVIKEFKAAIEIDSTFAEAWLKLAEIYSYRMLPNRYISEFLNLNTFHNHLDSARIAINNAEKYGKGNDALKMFIHSLNSTAKFEDSELAKNPQNTSEYYRYCGYLAYIKEDYYNAIKSWLKFEENLPDIELEEISDLHYLNAVAAGVGFPDVCDKFVHSALEKTLDSAYYKYSLIPATSPRGPKLYMEMLYKYYHLDTSEIPFVNFLMNCYLLYDPSVFSGIAYMDSAYFFLKKRVDLFKKQNRYLDPNIYMACIYKYFGEEKKSMWHIQKTLENRSALIDTIATPMKSRNCIQLALAYSLLNQKDSVLLCIDKISQLETMPGETISQINYLKRVQDLEKDQQFLKYYQQILSHFGTEREKTKQLFIEKGFIEPEKEDV